jgi:hypothetical protein
VLSALRALVAATPVVLVLGGIFFMSRDPEPGAPHDPTECLEDGCPTVLTLTAEDEERMHRLALKTETAIDLLDGRMTVADAAARFLELSASDPESLDNMRKASEGSTDEEKALDQLLAFARIQAIRQPERYAAAFAQAQQWAKSHERSRPTH